MVIIDMHSWNEIQLQIIYANYTAIQIIYFVKTNDRVHGVTYANETWSYSPSFLAIILCKFIW